MTGVRRVADCDLAALRDLLSHYQLQLKMLALDAEIPGSYWGESEAGLVADCLYARSDTPVHSVLHEACHFICMDEARRNSLHRDAGGDDAEENAVCYLQIVLAKQLKDFGSERVMADMDLWGYTFRLGSARAWFQEDASDALQWLIDRKVLDEQAQITWRLRDQ